RERHPVDHRVKLVLAQRLGHRCGIADVGAQHSGFGWRWALAAAAPVEQVEVDALVNREPRAGGADNAGAADEQNLEGLHASTVVADAARRAAPQETAQPPSDALRGRSASWRSAA